MTNAHYLGRQRGTHPGNSLLRWFERVDLFSILIFHFKFIRVELSNDLAVKRLRWVLPNMLVEQN